MRDSKRTTEAERMGVEAASLQIEARMARTASLPCLTRASSSGRNMHSMRRTPCGIETMTLERLGSQRIAACRTGSVSARLATSHGVSSVAPCMAMPRSPRTVLRAPSQATTQSADSVDSAPPASRTVTRTQAASWSSADTEHPSRSVMRPSRAAAAASTSVMRPSCTTTACG